MEAAKKNILIVDDDENTVRIIKTRLEMDPNYEILIAKTGEDALKISETKRPDLILLDLMMPGVSGIEVCDSIRHNPDLERTPIIIISALDDLRSQQECARMGISAYITKPINGKLLDNKVKQVLFAAEKPPAPPVF
jgi:putative two-component system response regulator